HLHPAADVCSSLDPAWVGHSGRSIEVEVTTLDAMVGRHGMPRYIKLDIEGAEPLALAGLSRPPEILSLEYHTRPGRLARARACLEEIAGRGWGPRGGNLTPLDSFAPAADDWLSGADWESAWAAALAHPTHYWGDLYLLLGGTD